MTGTSHVTRVHLVIWVGCSEPVCGAVEASENMKFWNLQHPNPRLMPSKCYIQHVSKSVRPKSGHRTGKGQSSSQFPRRVVLKNILTIRQLHSSPMLVRSCLKSCMLGLSIMRTKTYGDPGLPHCRQTLYCLSHQRSQMKV